ncbi:MAG: hypothetical protein QM758_01740 [Armatimonas sp.]
MGFRIDQSYSDTGGTRHLSIVGNKIRIQETKSFWKDGKPTIQQSLPPQKPTKDKTATLSARDLTVLQSVVRSSGFFAARGEDDRFLLSHYSGDRVGWQKEGSA